MKNKFIKLFLIIFSLTFLGNFLFVFPAGASLQLVKSKDFGTVYYIDSRGVRHAFPNQTTYKSWYGNDYSSITTVSNEILANYPLGKNITIRPGTYLVKVQTSPEVYLVEQGGVLREIQNEDIATALYGQGWAKRVVDVPDVFFGDYIVGSKVVHDYHIPDSLLYYNTDRKKYYFKNNGIVQEFSSEKAVKENYFNLDYAFKSSREFYVRSRPIEGFDKNVFNPVAEPLFDKRDCENKNLKAAFILVVDEDFTTLEAKRLQSIKIELPEYFSWVTNELSELDLNYPTSVMYDDGYFLTKRNDGTTEVKNEVINSFYDNNPDEFDFIFIFTNFKVPSENSNEIARFIPVTNKQEGLNLSILDSAEIFGSTGKLKGIIMMGDINKYKAETAQGLSESLNVSVHEILHNWAAYIYFKDEKGELSDLLLRDDDYAHWSNYVGFISPLGGSGWIDNGDGTWTNGLTKLSDTNKRQYSKLDLYLMGLIPYQLMEPIMYLEPEVEGEMGNVIKATPHYVTIDQIIAGSGRVKCSLD